MVGMGFAAYLCYKHKKYQGLEGDSMTPQIKSKFGPALKATQYRSWFWGLDFRARVWGPKPGCNK